jgi:capsid protein
VGVRRQIARGDCGTRNRRARAGLLQAGGLPNDQGVQVATLEAGTMQELEPGEDVRFNFRNYLDLMRVPSDDVMHLFRPLRPGQLRGVPWLANALVRLWELDQYDDAELP